MVDSAVKDVMRKKNGGRPCSTAPSRCSLNVRAKRFLKRREREKTSALFSFFHSFSSFNCTINNLSHGNRLHLSYLVFI